MQDVNYSILSFNTKLIGKTKARNLGGLDIGLALNSQVTITRVEVHVRIFSKRDQVLRP